MASSTQGLWVFGYGSLCWNPGFDFETSCIGFIRGYKRRFSQGNTFHRGTQDKPGRVATLIEDKNGIVWGRAFLITGEAALSYLAERECKIGGYKTVFAPVFTLKEEPISDISQTEIEDYEELDLEDQNWRQEHHVLHTNLSKNWEFTLAQVATTSKSDNKKSFVENELGSMSKHKNFSDFVSSKTDSSQNGSLSNIKFAKFSEFCNNLQEQNGGSFTNGSFSKSTFESKTQNGFTQRQFSDFDFVKKDVETENHNYTTNGAFPKSNFDFKNQNGFSHRQYCDFDFSKIDETKRKISFTGKFSNISDQEFESENSRQNISHFPNFANSITKPKKHLSFAACLKSSLNISNENIQNDKTVFKHTNSLKNASKNEYSFLDSLKDFPLLPIKHKKEEKVIKEITKVPKSSKAPTNCTKFGLVDSDFEPVTQAAIVYIATPDNEQWLGDAKVPSLARDICNTSGKNGHNIDYILNLAKFVRENCPFEADFHLFELENEIIRQKPNHECIFYEKLELQIIKQNGEGNNEAHVEIQNQVLEFSKRVPSKKLRCLNI